MNKLYSPLDLSGLSITNFRVNPLTTSARTALTLGTGDKGFVCFDTDLNLPYWWTGAAWLTLPSGSVAGALIYKGTAAASAAIPTSPTSGDFYVFNSSGTNAWNVTPTVAVSPGDQIFYNGSTWEYILDEKTVPATTSTSGSVTLATQTEANTGTNTTKVVTPETLAGYASNKAFAKTYFQSGIAFTANTPVTISHNLNLQNKDAYTIRVSVGGSAVALDDDSVNVNSITLTSAINVTGVSVCIIGF